MGWFIIVGNSFIFIKIHEEVDMYKDVEKQREANRERQRRYRALRKGVTGEGVTSEGVTFKPECVTCDNLVDGGNDIAACEVGGCDVTGEPFGHIFSAGYGINWRGGFRMTVMERLFYRPELKSGELNFVSLPGRACYGVYE